MQPLFRRRAVAQPSFRRRSMRQSHIAFGAATIFLAACGGNTEQRAATGGLGGAAAGALVGGPVGALVGAAAGASGGAVLDEGVDQKVAEATASEAEGSEATASRATASGADVLEEIDRWNAFSTFSQAVEATDLKDTLAGDGPFTVFAPTNDAFAQLPEGTVDELMAQENRDELEALLRHHVVQGERLAPTAIPERIEPMEGGEISATMSGGELILSGGEDDGQGARVIGYAPADNGAVHVIDSVLMTKDVRDLLDGQPRG
jgi:uncharacterized surface protein with fasciclin (FAS1) repeats